MKNHISYSLTKNIPGPKLKIESAKQGFELIQNWCEQYTIGQFRSIEFYLEVPQHDQPNLEFLDLEFLRQPVSSTIEYSLIQLKIEVLEWKVVLSRLPILFQLISTHLELFESYNFRIRVGIDCVLLDENGQVLKEQYLYSDDDHTWILAFINNKTISIEPTLYFPFKEDDANFKKFFHYFKGHFPFKLNEKNLYIWGKKRRKLR